MFLESIYVNKLNKKYVIWQKYMPLQLDKCLVETYIELLKYKSDQMMRMVNFPITGHFWNK